MDKKHVDIGGELGLRRREASGGRTWPIHTLFPDRAHDELLVSLHGRLPVVSPVPAGTRRLEAPAGAARTPSELRRGVQGTMRTGAVDR